MPASKHDRLSAEVPRQASGFPCWQGVFAGACESGLWVQSAIPSRACGLSPTETPFTVNITRTLALAATHLFSLAAACFRRAVADGPRLLVHTASALRRGVRDDVMIF